MMNSAVEHPPFYRALGFSVVHGGALAHEFPREYFDAGPPD